MKGRISYWNVQRRFGMIERHTNEGYIEKYFALAKDIVSSEVINPQQSCPVDFELSEEKPRKADGYPLVKNIKVYKSASMTVGLEVLTAPSNNGGGK